MEIFRTSAEAGLTRAEVAVSTAPTPRLPPSRQAWWQARQLKYGANVLPASPRPSVLLILLRQFHDFIILVRAGGWTAGRAGRAGCGGCRCCSPPPSYRGPSAT